MAEKDDKQGKKEGEPKVEPKEGDPKPGEGDNSSAGSQNAGDKEPGPIPYDRFKEVNDRAKAYEKRLAEIELKNLEREKKEDVKRQDELKEQEKFKELADEWEGKVVEMEPEFTQAKKDLEAANTLLQAYADSQMESVPELFRDVVAGLPLTDRLEWLTANKDKLGKGKLEGIPATPKGQGSGDEITSQQRRQKSARTF